MIQNADLRNQLGKAARKRFEDEFEIGRVVLTTQQLYRKHLEEIGFFRPVRLMEVVTNLCPGGVPRHVEDLIKNLSSEIFKIEAVTGETDEDKIRQLGCKHHYVELTKPINPWQDLKSLWQLYWFFKREKPDIVHSHMSKASCLASISARLAGVPSIITTIHGKTSLTRHHSIKQIIYDAVEFISLRFFAHGTISVSHATARHLIESGKVMSFRNATIHNGVQPLLISNINKLVNRQRLGIQESQPVILMTGRLAEPKTPEILIQACGVLRSQFPDLICFIAGEGPRRQELENMVNEKSLSSMVRLLGHRDDIQDLLSITDIFVLSSWQEGLPISILEAMSAKLPIVASRVPGMEEVVSHGETGYLIAEGSVEACAEAIKTLLTDATKRLKMGEASYQKYCHEFSLSYQVEVTQALLWTCAQGGFPRNYYFGNKDSQRMEKVQSMAAVGKV